MDFGRPINLLTDPNNGETCKAHLFVSVLGASDYTCTEATSREGLEDWIAVHTNAFEYFSGCTELTIRKNLDSFLFFPLGMIFML